MAESAPYKLDYLLLAMSVSINLSVYIVGYAIYSQIDLASTMFMLSTLVMLEDVRIKYVDVKEDAPKFLTVLLVLCIFSQGLMLFVWTPIWYLCGKLHLYIISTEYVEAILNNNTGLHMFIRNMSLYVLKLITALLISFDLFRSHLSLTKIKSERVGNSAARRYRRR